MKLTITVTKEILEKSKNCKGDKHGQKCAIALATRDIFPNAWVYPYGIATDGYKEDIRLPAEATEFIDLFDRLQPDSRAEMQPISFDIDIPDEVIEKINIDEIKPLLVNHPTLKLCV